MIVFRSEEFKHCKPKQIMYGNALIMQELNAGEMTANLEAVVGEQFHIGKQKDKTQQCFANWKLGRGGY